MISAFQATCGWSMKPSAIGQACSCEQNGQGKLTVTGRITRSVLSSVSTPEATVRPVRGQRNVSWPILPLALSLW
jgi:hypothetical protein